MSVWRRIATGTAIVLTVSLSLTSCSLDPTGNPTGPSDSLGRKTDPITPAPVTYDCRVVAADVFGNGGGLPFTLACEDMGEAELTETSQSYSGDGCMVEVRGTVYFPSTNHTYAYLAKTRDCQHDGGTLEVCASHWGNCKTVRLPHLTIVEVEDVREPSK